MDILSAFQIFTLFLRYVLGLVSLRAAVWLGFDPSLHIKVSAQFFWALRHINPSLPETSQL